LRTEFLEYRNLYLYFYFSNLHLIYKFIYNKYAKIFFRKINKDFKDYLFLCLYDLFIFYKSYYYIFNYDIFIFKTDSFIVNQIDDFDLHNNKFLFFFNKKSINTNNKFIF
jgi:hypothetical protein